MKQIIVNVSGLTIEEKQRVNEALAKIKNMRMCNPMHWDKAAVMYGPSVDGFTIGFDYYDNLNTTHTPQQVLEMAGMAKQGHVHADLMALYAEDAKTTAKPWELWELLTELGTWVGVGKNPDWCADIQYRRKPKTHIVNGVEVPDLRFVPCDDQYFYKPEPYARALVAMTTLTRKSRSGEDMIRHNLCYEYTEAGKQAAILHAKAWLGIA